MGILGLQKGLNNCTGVEVHLKQDGSHSVRVVGLSLDKKLIRIDRKKAYQGQLTEVLKNKISGPVALTLTGKGILIKKTARLDLVSDASLQHLFPQLKLTEFYVQHFPAGAHSFIAIVRREIADGLIFSFKALGIDILMLSLGAFVVDQVIPQLNAYTGSLCFDGHQVVINEEKDWEEYSYHPELKTAFPIKVDIEVMPEEFLLAYATAFQLILNEQLDLIEVDAPEISGNLQELSAKLKFTKYGGLMLVCFLLLLMINFLLLSSYNSSNQELSNKAGQKSYIFENRQKLEDAVKDKENLVLKLGWNKGYRYAYLCDQIGQTLPKGIKLSELQINPLYSATVGMLKDVQLEVGNMRIKGQTNSVYAVNEWIDVLKGKSWVKDVQLEKYTADDQKQVQVFTIQLSY